MEREISIILKVKGAAEAKKAVDDVFSNAAIGKVTKFTAQANQAGNAVQNAGAKARSAGTGINSFTKVLGRSMAAIYLYRRAWNMLGTQFEEGMGLERASEQFDKNVGSVTKMLPELRDATKGVVSDFDLLKTASKAFQLGLKPQMMASAFKMATVASQKLGLEASDAINTITNALTKQDEGALNTLGITTKVNQAYATQTALVSKNGGVMSSAMKIQLRQSLILQELRKRFGGVNEVQEDGLLVLDRFKASWKNFRAVLGQTIGVALVPLMKSLTGALNIVTALLDRINHTEGLKTFVKLSGTLVAIWSAKKFIDNISTLVRLFGLFGGSNLLKMPKMLSVVTGVISKLGKVVLAIFPQVRNFIAALGFVAPRLASALSFVPGWGVALTAVILLFKPLMAILKKAWVAGKVFFQLLSSFDEDSGMSKVLKSDADELGSFINVIKLAAQSALFLGKMFGAAFDGIVDSFKPVGEAFDWMSDKLKLLGIDIGDFGTLSSKLLNNWADNVRSVFRYVSSIVGGALTGAAAGSLFGPLGTLIGGALGAAGGLGVAAMHSNGNASQSSPAPQTSPQMSTQQTSPDIRPQNLNQSDAMNDILMRIDKKLGAQTDIMVNDSQKQDIRDSQKSADIRQWNRK